MKNLVLSLLVLMLSGNLNAQKLWDDYDNPSDITYTFVNGALNQNFFNSLADNVNPSDTCARYARNGAVQYDVIVIETPSNMTDLSGYLDSTLKMSMKVWGSNVGDTVQITLEDNTVATGGNYPTGRHSEYRAVKDSSNAWEVLEFTLFNKPDPTVSDTSVNQMVILFKPNTFTSDVFLFDDLMGPFYGNPCDSVAPDSSILDDFECQRNISYAFENVTKTVEDNPLQAGVNTSSKCAKVVKWTDPDTLGVPTDGAFGGDLDFKFTTDKYKTAYVSLYDPSAPSNFYVIFRNAADSTLLETIVTTTSTSTWEEFSVDLRDIPSNIVIDNYVLLINPATQTADSIYFDDFRLSPDTIVPTGPCAGVAVQPTIHEDFDCQRNMSYEFINGDNMRIANPVSDAVNASSYVGKITKWIDPNPNDTVNVPNDGAFGGPLDNPFTTATYKTGHISLYDPSAPQDFIFILQDASETTLIEKTFTTSSTTGWQEFKVDLSGIPTSTSIARWIFVFNPATNTADSIYYDNFKISNDPAPQNVADKIAKEMDVMIYPNPVQNQLYVESVNYDIDIMKIYNMLGEEVASVKVGAQTFTYDVSTLPQGSYSLLLVSKNGLISTQKIVK